MSRRKATDLSSTSVTLEKEGPEGNKHEGLNPREFGMFESERYLYRQHSVYSQEESEEDLTPYRVVIFTYISYLLLIIIGHIRDIWDSQFNPQYKKRLTVNDGYAPLLTDFESFYTRRLKARVHDCFSRTTTGVPGRITKVMDRKFKPDKFYELEETGPFIDCVNLGSYNYLGFAQSVGQCTDAAKEVLRKYGITAGGTRFGGATHRLHLDTEQLAADFLGKEAAMIWSTGYGTNANIFCNLVDSKSLVLSDELNHTSIRTGLRSSGAVIKVFKHNNMTSLETLIREQIAQGHPRTHRPWKKILVVVEGLYSMEGTLCPLPQLVELRRKYGIYLFVDEAHSIGALGPNGGGVCDYFNVSPTEVDILMGTFTKSFGAVGGYIAGDRDMIDKLKVSNIGNVYAEAPTAPVLAQITAAMRTLRGELRPGEGQERLQRLAFNSRYFRLALQKMGFVCSGHIDSPVIPLMLYFPQKMALVSRELLARRVAIVVVGYPATPLLLARIRFCMSAALTKSDLDYVLEAMDEVGDLLWLKNSVKNKNIKHFHEFRDTLVDEAVNYDKTDNANNANME